MSRVIEPRRTSPPEMTELFAPVLGDLKQVEQVLRDELTSQDPFVRDLVRYGFRMGGKRLRPALLLLCGRTVGDIRQAHIVLAAAVEMIHTATLIHDDVLDEATLRRHAETVNARWSNETSVLLGDFLFTHAFYLASTLGSTYACRTIGRATNAVCEGELRQTAARGNYHLTEEQYLEIIAAKTGQLCACCCQLGAHFAGASRKLEETLRQFGLNLGIAFQIADDLLDLVGDEQTVGKSLGTDMGQRKPTLPVIHALARMGVEEKSQIVDTMLSSIDGDGQGALSELLVERGSIRYAQDKARQFASRALRALEPIGTWNAARQSLEVLAHFVTDRRC